VATPPASHPCPFVPGSPVAVSSRVPGRGPSGAPGVLSPSCHRLCHRLSCENFLYGFKAARRAARAADTARTPPLSLTLRYGGANAGRLARKDEMRAARHTASFMCAGGVVPAPAAGIVRGRSEPVKAVCDRRATASVKLPGERTREDDLDRTCPDQELAAIGSRDTSGQVLDI
jgi:hypothetical protein